MKIDSDLRAVIRAAEKMQRDQHTWQAKHDRQQRSLAGFLADHPAAAKILARARAEIDRLTRQLHRQSEIINSFGLYLQGNGKDRSLAIADETKFKRAGGKIVESPLRWRAEAVLAQLAAAQPNQRAQILKRCGINWV